MFRKITQQRKCELERTRSQQSAKPTNEVHWKEVSLRSADPAVSMQWTHISSKNATRDFLCLHPEHEAWPI